MTAARHAALKLQAVIAADEADGIPVKALASQTSRLDRDLAATGDSVFTTTWWSSPAPADVPGLAASVSAVWHNAVAVARSQADSEIEALSNLQSKDKQWLPTSPAPPTPAQWTSKLDHAATPKAIVLLQTQWAAQVTALQGEATTTQRQDAIAAQEGSNGLLGEAAVLLDDAAGDNLQPGDVAALASQYKAELAAGSDTAQTSAALVTAEQQLQAAVTLNNTLFTSDRTLLYATIQAQAEGTPGSAAEASSYASVHAAYLAATTLTALQAVQAQQAAAQAAVNADLAANVCGHTNEPMGQVITISLSLEEMVFYQNQCVVNATPVTTGRPGRPTPTCNCHVYDKISPFEMISEDPTSSPYWYPPTWVTWVMGIEGPGMPGYEGYFIHNAYWEPNGTYGPGSQYGPDASHGCIHTPHDVMQWAYSWTNIGTPVIISN